jgi:hypothetical protein
LTITYSILSASICLRQKNTIIHAFYACKMSAITVVVIFLLLWWFIRSRRPPSTARYTGSSRVIGAEDASWFQAYDRSGNMIASYMPTGTPTTSSYIEHQCDRGEVTSIGVRDTTDGPRLGPISCNSDTTSWHSMDSIYMLAPEASACPTGYRRSPSMRGVRGVSFICVPDPSDEILCSSQNECPDGFACSGGRCVHVSDF